MENEINIDATVDAIASDIGLGSGDEHTEETTETTESTETSTSETTQTTAGEETTQSAPTVRAAPKAWAKEQHERWGKLDKDTQDYIELREKQALEGVMQYKTPADEWNAAVKDYLPLIQAQNAKPHEAVRYLFEAHRNLSSGTPEQKAAYLQTIAKQYGIDFAKAAASPSAGDETPAQRETRERLERIESGLAAKEKASREEQTRYIASAVQSFADEKDDKGNLTHPYFDECAEDIIALINAGHALDKAYEKAIHANPVTRAKERERERKADEEALRAKAKLEAERARNASRTNVNSRDTRRAPTASKANSWEDTLEDTMKEIKTRAH